MTSYRPSELRALGIQPKRSLSQNFLIDRNIIRKTLDAAEVTAEDHVLEIGPGIGAVTEQLFARGATVTAIERDLYLAKALQEKLNMTVLCDNALTAPLSALPKPTKLVANLPFHISTLLIRRLILRPDIFSSLTFFVQKEVGNRICARPGTRDYSSFSVFIRAYATPRFCFHVSPNSFFPAPKVTSSVIHLKPHPFSYLFEEKAFFEMTRTAFSQRRKMLRKTLRPFASLDVIERALEDMGYSPTARPGELDLDGFASLFQRIQPKGKG
jgi:16S rRNA (adenine1518-N6/adenine1519-N6)-dimethyltransferase